MCGDDLKILIIRAGFRHHSDFAKQADIHPSTLAKIITGKRAPNEGHVARIREVLESKEVAVPEELFS